MKKYFLNTTMAGMFFATSILACSKKNNIEANNPVLPTDSTRRHYRDGVYSAIGEYGNLPSHITVTLTLKGDTITTTTVQPHATDPTSLDLQKRFAEAVPAVVVGRHIDEVNVGRLAGSSGTPVGFNDAIRQIKIKAVR